MAHLITWLVLAISMGWTAPNQLHAANIIETGNKLETALRGADLSTRPKIVKFLQDFVRDFDKRYMPTAVGVYGKTSNAKLDTGLATILAALERIHAAADPASTDTLLTEDDLQVLKEFLKTMYAAENVEHAFNDRKAAIKDVRLGQSGSLLAGFAGLNTKVIAFEDERRRAEAAAKAAEAAAASARSETDAERRRREAAERAADEAARRADEAARSAAAADKKTKGINVASTWRSVASKSTIKLSEEQARNTLAAMSFGVEWLLQGNPPYTTAQLDTDGNLQARRDHLLAQVRDSKIQAVFTGDDNILLRKFLSIYYYVDIGDLADNDTRIVLLEMLGEDTAKLKHENFVEEDDTYAFWMKSDTRAIFEKIRTIIKEFSAITELKGSGDDETASISAATLSPRSTSSSDATDESVSIVSEADGSTLNWVQGLQARIIQLQRDLEDAGKTQTDLKKQSTAQRFLSAASRSSAKTAQDKLAAAQAAAVEARKTADEAEAKAAESKDAADAAAAAQAKAEAEKAEAEARAASAAAEKDDALRDKKTSDDAAASASGAKDTATQELAKKQKTLADIERALLGIGQAYALLDDSGNLETADDGSYKTWLDGAYPISDITSGITTGLIAFMQAAAKAAELVSVEAQAATQAAKIQALEAEVANLTTRTSELETVRTRLAELSTKDRKSTEELAKLQAALTAAQEEIKQLKAEIERLKAELAAKSSSEQTALAQASQATRDLEKEREKIRGLESANSALRGAAGTREKSLSDENKRLATASVEQRGRIVELEANNAALQKEVARLGARVTELEGRIRQLDNTLRGITQENAALKAQNDTLRSSAQTILAENKRLADENTRLQRMIDEKNNLIDTLNAELDSLYEEPAVPIVPDVYVPKKQGPSASETSKHNSLLQRYKEARARYNEAFTRKGMSRDAEQRNASAILQQLNDVRSRLGFPDLSLDTWPVVAQPIR